MDGMFALGSFLVYNVGLLALKSVYVKIENQMKQNILQNGLYHITSEENAEKIMNDGQINPSNWIASLGKPKTFFFAGIPTIGQLMENVAGAAGQFEITAINVQLDENDIKKYRIRALDDNSVVCKGACKLQPGKVKKVSLVLDMDKDGIPYMREKTADEIENGYEPCEELKEKFKPSSRAMMVKKNLLKAYFMKPFSLLKQGILKLQNKNKEEPDIVQIHGKSNIFDENSKDGENRNDVHNKYRVDDYVFPQRNGTDDNIEKGVKIVNKGEENDELDL